MTYIDPPTSKHPHRERTQKDRENTRRIESVLIRKPPLSYEEMVEEYRKIETDLVEQAGDDEFDIVETRRRIAEWILTAAFLRDQPFDVCEKSWNHLLDLGFNSLDTKCSMTCLYADCCLENEQEEIGLAVVEPAIAELEQWLTETTLEPHWRVEYESTLASLKKRRDKLRAGIQG
jgi:hypothetical protein